MDVPSEAFLGDEGMAIDARNSFPEGPSPVHRLSPTGLGFTVTLDDGIQPGRPVSLAFTYTDADVAGTDDRKLVLARYDDTRGFWTPLPTERDPSNHRLTGLTDHFSLFQVMMLSPGASVGEAKAFPNPLRPALGQRQMKFSDIPAGSEVKIFTMQGELVRTLHADDLGEAPWDGKNAGGQSVASGVYIVRIEGVGGKKILKVAVQR
jgi:hypothetical protein